MDDIYKPPNILVLTNVKLSDCVSSDDSILDNITNIIEYETDYGNNYDRIPEVFTTLDEWPKHTNLLCWTCSFIFKTTPKFIPTNIRESETGILEISVLGNMCSFACAEKWIEDLNETYDNKWRLQNNLLFLCNLFHADRKTKKIKSALSKTKLKKYGGNLTDVEFIEQNQIIENT